MAKYLVIVESPAKSKTIEKYLGEDFIVTSSKGHIRDLTTRGHGGYGVVIEEDFKPMYKIMKDKKEVVKELKKEVKNMTKIYLATDPDREGEAISWHLFETLGLNEENYERIVFNEITKTAVLNAIEHSRKIDMDLVKSQETRRILDRIIGFSLSKLLQKKIGSKSAGRVQSVALKLVVDREKEIRNFIPEEYWEIFIESNKKNKKIKAKLERFNKEKIKLNNENETNEVLNNLGDEYKVLDIASKVRQKPAKPPFITSTLQQEASSKYNYISKRTMMIAQRLYEGIELKNERVGLITYMRTDSVRLSNDFINETKDYITKEYGSNYYGGYTDNSKPSKNVQDAHEAIRPSKISYTPESIKEYLSNEEYKLYSLIYDRAISSLMSNAIIEDTKVIIENNGYEFDTTGEKVKFDGYMRVYGKYESSDYKELPEFGIGDVIDKCIVTPEQKFTNPPLRYSEARLIKKMEELGIGRPSTYSVTMDTLKIRNYIKLDKKMFLATDQGILTSEKLDEYFNKVINIKYTAKMEEKLDDIAEGKLVSHEQLKEFYEEFKPLLEFADDNMEKIYPVVLDDACPECGSPLVIRNGRFGEFVACSGFPKCRYIKKEEKEEVLTGVKCPVCNEGEIVERVSKRGRSKGKKFYACNRYPTCKTTFTDLPTEEDYK